MLISCADDLAQERRNWLIHLRDQRRVSPKTIDAYERDTRQFLLHLTSYLGHPPAMKNVSNLKPVDMRGFLASRRQNGAKARTLGRGLAGIRSLIRYLEKKGLANSAGLTATSAPRQPKTLPKALPASGALRLTKAEEQLHDSLRRLQTDVIDVWQFHEINYDS